ncbi:hypothetical protein GCM10019017_68030 [Streptomyces showdoensis]
MRPFDAERRAEGAEHRRHGAEVVPVPLGQAGGGAEARQVDRDDVPLGREDVEHRLPGLPVVADPVEQQQGLAPAPALVGEGHRARSAGGLHGERDLCGHRSLLSWDTP